MTIIVKIKDGSEFIIDVEKIKSVFVDNKFLKISLKKENIRFEKIQLESYKVSFPKDFKKTVNISYVPYLSILITIFTNILQNLELDIRSES